MTAMAPSELEVDLVGVAALRSWVELFAQEIAASRELLTELDSAIGDADHGTNMDRGLKAVVAALEKESPTTAASLFKTTGMTLVSTVGGASGPLYGTLFLRMAGPVGDSDPIDATQFAQALRAGLDGIVARGRAEAGDKTMYDALAPACLALDKALESGASLSEGLKAASAAADAGRDATIPLLARKGRASYLGERSVGHQDPGATSTAMLVAAASRALG
jgi:dihydroxyacetone kinase-like protein